MRDKKKTVLVWYFSSASKSSPLQTLMPYSVPRLPRIMRTLNADNGQAERSPSPAQKRTALHQKRGSGLAQPVRSMTDFPLALSQCVRPFVSERITATLTLEEGLLP